MSEITQIIKKEIGEEVFDKFKNYLKEKEIESVEDLIKYDTIEQLDLIENFTKENNYDNKVYKTIFSAINDYTKKLYGKALLQSSIAQILSENGNIPLKDPELFKKINEYVDKYKGD